MKEKKMKGYLYLAPALVIILLFTVYPLIKAFLMSFYENYNMIDGSHSGIGLSNYKELFEDAVFLKALKNTGIYVLFVVPCSVTLSLFIAVLLNSKIKFQGMFQTLYFLPYVTSVIAIGIVWSWIFNSNYGLLNYMLGWFGIAPVEWLNSPDHALTALIIFSIWKSMAFDILIFLAGLQTISQDIYRAARIDSTPAFRVFTKITVPGIAPMIAYAMIMGLINAFKVYNEVFSLFKGKAGPANSAITVVYYIYDKFYNSANYGVASAAAVILFAIILFFTMIQMKASKKGMEDRRENMKNRKMKWIMVQILKYAVLIVGALFTLLPFVWMIASSLKSPSEIVQIPPTLFPKQAMFSNYARAWAAAPFARYLFNTILVTVFTTTGVLVTTVLSAFAFSRLDFPGKKIVFSLFLATLMIPGEMLIITNFITITKLKWIDTYQAMIVPWIANAFYIYLLTQFFLQVPESLYLAAKIDKCSDFKYMIKIMVPMNKQAITTIAILNIISSWNAFLWPLLVTNSDEMRVLSNGLIRFQTEAGSSYELIMAASCILVMPIILIYLFLRKYVIEGVTQSGLKA